MEQNQNRNMSFCSAFSRDGVETVAYNNPLFPAYFKYSYLSLYPDFSAVSHWHEDLEFILVKRGRMTYNINGELIELSENNGIMVNSRQIHYGFSAERTDCEFICMLFSPALFQGNRWFYQNYIEAVTENPCLPYLYLDRNGWQAAVLKKMDALYRLFCDISPEDCPEKLPYFELLEGFVSIMKILYRNLPTEDRIPDRRSAELKSLKNMITYVEEHFSEHIALDDIAAAGACCKSRCGLLFKKYFRDTPVSYVTKLRLRKSLAALLDSDGNVTDIAYEYGFGGASYYCETFRKYYGVSPLQYKKTHSAT